MRPVQMVAVLLIAQTMAGCSGSSITGPSGPNGTVTNGTVTSIPSDAPKPTISTISPDTGSIYGGSWVTIVGEIDRGATLTLGGILVDLGYSSTDPTTRSFVSPPHAAGPVDLVVRNPDGGSQTVVGGYTYVELGSLDFDGEWAGYTVDGSDTWVEITVREQLLTSARCTDERGRVVEIAFSQPFVNGKIEFAGAAGRFSAWPASASEMAGTIDIAPCSGGRRWQAERNSTTTAATVRLRR